jgi:hypothetical protein
MINIPNTVLSIDFSIPLRPLLDSVGASSVQRRRSQTDTAVTIAHRVIFRAGSVYA